MALTAGTKLGPYELTGTVGAGGMGEVYRARDSRLQRDVAVKVLPSSFSTDPERLRRFEQEARATAALNHPNILAVYDLGTENGAPYIVSELLKGETLREQLRSGPLPVRKAIDLAAQIAEGLAAAHDKGIVHRDLKPENIFVTEEGRAKILDFGLAKLTQREADHDGQTVTGAIDSDAGTVLGTVGYMSPEQVRAKLVDARSDLFSFGAILYEMLSGRRAFHGESAAETMSAIVREEPPDLTETNRNISPALERIVRHCLEKNPAQRFQSAHDLAFDLETLSGTSKLSLPIPLSAPERSRWPAIAAISLVALLATGGAFLSGRRLAHQSPPRFHVVTYRSGTVYRARFARDSETIVYAASWEGKPLDLFTTKYDSVQSRELASEALVAAISSKNDVAVLLQPSIVSGGSVAISTGTLAVISVEGGAPRPLAKDIQWADWTPDGSDLAVIRQSEKLVNPQVNVLQFPIDKTIYDPSPGWVSHVRFSPDGKYLSFLEHIPRGDDGRVVITDREGKVVATSGHYNSINGLAWAPDGAVWYTAAVGEIGRTLYALDLHGRTRELYRAPGDIQLFDIAANGRVLFSTNSDRLILMAGGNGVPDGVPDKDLSWLDWSLGTDISDDGSTVLFSESAASVNGRATAFLRKVDGSPAVELGEGLPISISPDGNWVATLDIKQPANIVLLPTGVGKPLPLTSNGWEYNRLHWMPDSKAVVVLANPPGQEARVYRIDIASRQIRPLLPEGVRGALVSPDGKHLAALDAGVLKIYDLNGTEVRTLAGLSPKEAPDKWSSDGNSLLLWNYTSTPQLERMDVITGKRTLVTAITPPVMTGIVNITGCHSTPDGKAHIYSERRLLTTLVVASDLH